MLTNLIIQISETAGLPAFEAVTSVGAAALLLYSVKSVASHIFPIQSFYLNNEQEYSVVSNKAIHPKQKHNRIKLHTKSKQTSPEVINTIIKINSTQIQSLLNEPFAEKLALLPNQKYFKEIHQDPTSVDILVGVDEKPLSDSANHTAHYIWWSPNKNSNNSYVMPSKELEKFIATLQQWQERHPHANFVLHHNANSDAIRKTAYVITNEIPEINLQFNRIDKEPFIQENRIILDVMPTYYITDWMKLYILVSSALSRSKLTHVFSDIDYPVPSYEQLFNMMSIDDHGNVKVKKGIPGYLHGFSENQIQVLSAKSTTAINAMIDAMNILLMRAYWAIEKAQEGDDVSHHLERMNAIVYQYTIKWIANFMMHADKNQSNFRLLIDQNQIQQLLKSSNTTEQLSSSQKLIPYHPLKHGYFPFGLVTNDRSAAFMNGPKTTKFNGTWHNLQLLKLLFNGTVYNYCEFPSFNTGHANYALPRGGHEHTEALKYAAIHSADVQKNVVSFHPRLKDRTTSSSDCKKVTFLYEKGQQKSKNNEFCEIPNESDIMNNAQDAANKLASRATLTK